MNECRTDYIQGACQWVVRKSLQAKLAFESFAQIKSYFFWSTFIEAFSH